MVPLALLTVAACFDPTSYGAVPDDGKDDAPSIQKAIDAAIAAGGGEVCLGAGVWELDRAPTKRPLASLLITGGPVEIRGVGPKTILRMHGDAHKRDWRGLQIMGGHNVVLRDFTFDGLEAVDTQEQTHLVELGPDTHNVLVTNMAFGPMRRPDQHVGQGIGGDCLRLVGEKGREIEDVSVLDSKFTDCDRSGIGVQRGLSRILVARDEITGTGDAPIDFEPSGHGAIVDFLMTNLTIHRTMDAQGPYAMTIAGLGSDLAQRVTLAHSLLDGGGVGMINVDGVELIDNVITHGPKQTATILIIRHAEHIRIAGNTITRSAGVRKGPVIQVEHNHGQTPHDITIEDNTLRQETDAPVVEWTSASHLSFRRNKIEYTNSDDKMPIISATAVADDIDDLTISDNTVTGTSSALLRAHPRDHKFGTVELSRNSIKGVKRTLECGGPATSFATVVVDDAAVSGGICDHLATKPAAKPDKR